MSINGTAATDLSATNATLLSGGPFAASEPEIQAVQAYMRSISPDQGAGMVEMYSDGTSKDFCYGELGVASFVFELGTEHFQSCSFYENNIVPGNLPAMIYAAKVARAPYMIPAGPNIYGLAIGADNVSSGIMVALKGAVDDTQFNNSNGTEQPQNISSAEYYVDKPPWVNSPKPVAISLSPTDGIFNNKVETVKAQVDTTGWSDGQHIIFVRGQDADANWGAFSVIFLNIETPTPAINPGSDSTTSSEGASGGGGGCFLSTAAYGSSMAPHVKISREFRDRFLMESSMGKAFVNFYYKYSPPFAGLIKKHHNLRIIVRLTLFPLVCLSWVALELGITQTIIALMLLFGIGIIGLTKVRRK